MIKAFEHQEMSQKAEAAIWPRLLKGSGAQGFSRLVQIFIRLVEVPLLLSFWGTHLYGEWLMLSAIPSYLTIGDGGFATAACREMTIKGGAGDQNGVIAAFQSTWMLLIIVSISTLLSIFVFLKFAPIQNWLGFTDMNDGEIKIVLLLLILHVLINFQGELLNGGFWVTGHYPNGMYFIAFTQLIEFVFLAIIVFLGGGPVHAAFGFVSGKVLGTVFMWIGQRRSSRWLRHGITHASFAEIKRLTFPALASLAFPLGNALNIQGIRLVVGLALGPSAVAVFVPLRTLSRIVMQPGLIINRLIEPELAMAYGSGNDALFQQIFTSSCQLALWGCLCVCCIVGPGAYWIFPIWTDGIVSIQWPTYLILLAVVLINSIWYTALMVPYATNCHGRIALFYAFFYGFAALGLGYILSTKLGTWGAASALLLAEAIIAIVVINISLPMARIGVTQWLKTITRPPFDMIDKVSSGFSKRVSATSE